MILEHQQGYYDALNTANSSGESTVFVEFMLEMIPEALKQAYVSALDGTRSAPPEEKLLQLLKADSRMTIPQMAEKTGLGQRTVSRLLKRLQEQGRLRREGSAKSGRWIAG